MIIDGHTDVLCKYLFNDELNFYKDSSDLQLNYPNMVKSDMHAQIFAIYIPANINDKFKAAIQSIDCFYQKIVKDSQMFNIARSYEDIEKSIKDDKKIGILSLEGADSIEGDIGKLRTFYRLGVRAIGLTWNFANEVADGVMEKRGGGLTNFGYEVIEEMNRLGMMIDVSHLSEQGFWDVINISNTPIMASHSNAKSVFNHPRNLTDEQIKAIIKCNGMIGVTYVRDFTSNNVNPSINDLLFHIDHIVNLGGEKNIGFGSDFDGAYTLEGLENAGKVTDLVNALRSKYDPAFVKAIAGENWLNYFKKVL